MVLFNTTTNTGCLFAAHGVPSAKAAAAGEGQSPRGALIGSFGCLRSLLPGDSGGLFVAPRSGHASGAAGGGRQPFGVGEAGKEGRQHDLGAPGV